MPDLYITFAQPNPKGKDRPPFTGPTNDQLNEEWVEFTNPNLVSVSLEGVGLRDYTFDRTCRKTGERRLTTFSGSLSSKYSVRVHTGAGQPWDEGTRRHLYLNEGNYVWNNACGDTALLRYPSGGLIDWAQYAPNPPEGVLRRVPDTNELR